MGLLDTITGGHNKGASAALQQALEAIQRVRVPTADDLKFQIEKLVQTGTITPDQARTFLQNPSAFLNQNINQTGTGAQDTAIEGLLGAASEGGLNPVEQAKISDILRQLSSAEKGANDAVVQRQAERGALTGGETMAAQLQNNQNAAVNANQAGMNTAAEGYNAMLQELTSAGQLGGNLQGQQNEQANTVAASVDAINKFNAAQQQQQENFNVGNKNAAQEENTRIGQSIEAANVGNANEHAEKMANIPQTIYQDEMSKAGAEAGVNTNKANLETAQGGQNAALIGGLLGTAGEVGTGLTQKPVKAAHGGEIENYLSGGKVDGQASVPGDSPANDTVPAMLSPGEVVLPRTVAQNPEPDVVMSFLNRMRKPKSHHPDDVASVLDAMGKMREAV